VRASWGVGGTHTGPLASRIDCWDVSDLVALKRRAGDFPWTRKLLAR
jgi:hypothetical protein